MCVYELNESFKKNNILKQQKIINFCVKEKGSFFGRKTWKHFIFLRIAIYFRPLDKMKKDDFRNAEK